MKLLALTFAFLVIVGGETSSRKRRGVISLLDLIEDYCGSELTCNESVTNDLIFYLSGEPYDDGLDAGTSRFTILLECIDDKCGNDDTCREPLIEILKERILDGPL